MGQVPLVGRSSELARLDVLLGARQGGPHVGARVVLVSGEAGIGKTRLVHEAIARARQRDMLVLEGRADPLGAATAYAPFVEALGRCLRALGDKKRASLVDGLVDLRRLLVGLGGPAPAPSSDAQLEKARLFEAISLLLERLAGDGVLVLVLDDLHWADRATFELVLHLVRRLDEAPILLLATCRSDPAEATDGFSTLIGALRRLGKLDELTLDRLSADDTLAIARGILGEATPVQLVDVLARAGGVPLFAEMLVRSMIEAGRLLPGPLGWTLTGGTGGELPPVVRDVLASRLARLSADERRVIDCLAVAGGELPHADLVAVSALDRGRLDTALGTLRAAALVVEQDAGEVSYAAGHPLVLEVAYAALGAATRRDLHRRFIDVLEAANVAGGAAGDRQRASTAQRGDGPAREERGNRSDVEPAPGELAASGRGLERLARHYRGAGPTVDPDRAVRVLVAAGERALAVGAEDAAAQHLAGAVALLRAGGGAAPAAGAVELAPVLASLGVAWQRAGRGAAALNVWVEALPLVGEDAVARARLYLRMGLVEFDRGQLAAARDHYASGLEALGDRVVPELAQLQRVRAQLFDRIGDVAALDEVAQALAHVAERMPSPPTRVAALLVRTRAHFARDAYEAAAATLRDALHVAASDDRLRLECVELGMLIAIERGDLDAVRAHAEQTLALATRLGSPASQIRAYGYLATAQLFSGAWPDADRTLATIATLARRFAIPRAEARGRGMIGILACYRGELDAAARALADCRAIAAGLLDDRYLNASVAMAEWWLACERTEAKSDAKPDAKPDPKIDRETRATMDANLAVPGDMRCHRRLARAELAAVDGRPEDARAIVAELAATDAGPFHRAAAARAEAALHDACGEAAAARVARARAATAWLDAGMPYEAARDRLRATQGAEGEHASNHLIDEARACLTIFEQLGAARWADRARKRLRELGVRPAPVRRPGAEGGVLSKRELEVARAFAEGLSTAEVADKLVISPHTAATHLQRIYQRTGVNSRAALTRYLMDEGLL